VATAFKISGKRRRRRRTEYAAAVDEVVAKAREGLDRLMREGVEVFADPRNPLIN
jgi:hypothetical protein